MSSERLFAQHQRNKFTRTWALIKRNRTLQGRIRLSVQDPSASRMLLIMRSFYTASCCVSGGHIWISPSHLWVTITSHVFKISMNWPARCLHLFLQLWNLNSCSAVAFSAQSPSSSTPPHRILPAPLPQHPPPIPPDLRACHKLLSGLDWAVCILMACASHCSSGFAKLLGILHLWASVAISETTSETNLAQGSHENTPGPCPFAEARELRLTDWTAGTGLV